MTVGLCFNTFSQGKMPAGPETGKPISAEDAARIALNIGAKMPSFELTDATGKTVTSKSLLKQGNLVVVFYRGAWCPYCNLYLHNLQT